MIVYNYYLKPIELNISNYMDGMEDGFIYFSLDALNILKKHFSLIVYELVSDGCEIIIDILTDKICFFVSEYIKLPESVKKEICSYNLSNVTSGFYSEFMYYWQIRCSFNCFKQSSIKYSLGNEILSDDELVKKCIKSKVWIDMPKNYEEFCEVISFLIDLFEIRYNELDIKKEIKELLRSTEHRLLINYTDDELELYTLKFFHLFLKVRNGGFKYENK